MSEQPTSYHRMVPLTEIEQLCLEAFFLGLGIGFMLWVMFEHPEEANHIMEIIIGKVESWV